MEVNLNGTCCHNFMQQQEQLLSSILYPFLSIASSIDEESCGDKEEEVAESTACKQKMEDMDGQKLNWREHDWCSDWTIELVLEGRREGEKSETRDSSQIVRSFKVHLAKIAVGPRRCEYFTALAGNGGFSESNTRTSRIELSSKTLIDMFDILLDYVYDLRWQWQERIDLLPLYRLADRMGNESFKKQLLEEAELCDWDKENAKIFIERGKFWNCEEVTRQLKLYFSDLIACNYDLWPIREKFFDVPFWLSILDDYHEQPHMFFHHPGQYWERTHSLPLHVMQAFESGITIEQFTALTDKKYIRGPSDCDFEYLKFSDKFASYDDYMFRLSDFQKSCIGRIAEMWHILEPSVRGEIAEFVSMRPILNKELILELTRQIDPGSE